MKKYLIESVLGFNFNADITDKDGNLLSKGVKSSTISSNLPEKITPRVFDRSFFTHFNEDLLKKIRDYRKLND